MLRPMPFAPGLHGSIAEWVLQSEALLAGFTADVSAGLDARADGWAQQRQAGLRKDLCAHSPFCAAYGPGKGW